MSVKYIISGVHKGGGRTNLPKSPPVVHLIHFSFFFYVYETKNKNRTLMYLVINYQFYMVKCYYRYMFKY